MFRLWILQKKPCYGMSQFIKIWLTLVPVQDETRVTAPVYIALDNQTYFPTLWDMQASVVLDPSWSCEQLCRVGDGSFMRWAGAWSGEEALCPQECGEDTDHSSALSSTCCSGEKSFIKPAALSWYGEVSFGFIWTVLFGYPSSPETNAGFCYFTQSNEHDLGWWLNHKM